MAYSFGPGGAPADVQERCQALLTQYNARDRETAIMRAVRRGDFESVAPGSFTEDFPAPIIANRIDTMARDMAATLTLLPSFACTPSSILKDRAKKFADKRTKIANYYVESSNLQAQMPDAADSYHCYGLFVGEVRPDFKAQTPKIKLIDGATAYPVWDADFNTVEILLVSHLSESALKAYYPEQYKRATTEHRACVKQGQVKVYRHQDAKATTVYLPEAGGMVLEYAPNKLGKCSYVAVPRPMGEDWFTIPRGAFADLVYPLIAANELRMLALEATEKSVRAPIVLPSDVPDVPFGPDATIHTNNPQLVGRLKIDVPTAAFQSSELIDRDMQIGGMSPGSRSGSVNASVITGRGVEALGEGYSQQVAQAQTRIGIGLQKLINLAFEMDEKYWPSVLKEIRGQSIDNPGVESYTPSKDIAGDYTVSVDYGFLLGLDANRALVFILQAHGAGLLSTETAARNLPIKLDLGEETNRIQLEQLRTSLVGAVAATAQAVPEMLAQGQSPGAILGAFAAVIAGVKKSRPIEEVIAEVFKEPEPEQAPPPEDPMAAMMAGAPADQMSAQMANAGQAGPPDLNQFLAGLTGSGAPNLRANVSRTSPAA